MADGTHFARMMQAAAPVDMETAIALLEAGEALSDIRVDLGDGTIARANGSRGLQGLLQRLRGHQRVCSAVAGGTLVSMRSGKPDMHPDVAVILDAMKEIG